MHIYQLFKKIFKTTLVVIMAAALFGSMPGCRKKVSDDNFIFITLDTQRADFISAYNDGKASTPNIDSLAKKGILFENCYSLIPITLPSHASMFFSKPPYEVKNYNNGQIIRPKRNRPSFVSFFQKNGFYTAAFVSLGVITKKFGLDEGFDLYNDDFPDKRWYLTAEEVNNKVLPWLEESRDKKFFLWVHYSDPHDPYSPPDTPNDFKIFFNEKLLLDACLRKYEYHELNFELKSGKNRLRLEIKNQFVENENYFRGKMDRMEFFPEANSENLDIDLSRGWLIKRDRNVFFFKNNSIIDITNHKDPMEMSFSFRGSPILTPQAVRSLYKDEVEYMDGEIGKLLEKLRELDIDKRTKIMIIGDHGEGLGEYKNFIGDPHFGHIHYLNDVYMKIPLIIFDPHKPKNALRVKEIATPMDVAPTIFRMMGLKSFQGFRGKDLLHPEKHNETAIFMETHKPEAGMNKFAILQFPLHMIFTPENRAYQLFNLETDPEEKHDLFGNKDLPDEIKTLKQRLNEFARDVLKNKEEIKIDKKTEEMLRSLGYIK